MQDGETASIGHMVLVSAGFFVCVFCDFAAVIVSIAALFILRAKKKIRPDEVGLNSKTDL